MKFWHRDLITFEICGIADLQHKVIQWELCVATSEDKICFLRNIASLLETCNSLGNYC